MTRRRDQKQRQTPTKEFLIARIRELADLPFVDQIDDHFAGMWNEFGIQIKIRSGTPDCEVIGLRNEVLKCLRVIGREQKLPFTWIVGFWRDAKNIETLFPQDEMKRLEDSLRVY